MAGLDAEPLTQPYDVLHASKLFQDWLSALKERALLQTNHQSQAMLRSVLHSIRRRMTNRCWPLPTRYRLLPRGIFIEGWRPTDSGPIGPATARDCPRLVSASRPPESILTDVFAVLAEHSATTGRADHEGATLAARLMSEARGASARPARRASSSIRFGMRRRVQHKHCWETTSTWAQARGPWRALSTELPRKIDRYHGTPGGPP
jgi:uncharacterized protein (DUF2267 family)